MNCRWVFWLDPFFFLLVVDNLVLVNHEIAASEHSSQVYGDTLGRGGIGSYTLGSVGGPQHPFSGKEQCWGGGLLGFAILRYGLIFSLLAITSLALKKSCHQRAGRKPVGISHCGKGFPLVPLLPVGSLTSPLQVFDLPSVA